MQEEACQHRYCFPGHLSLEFSENSLSVVLTLGKIIRIRLLLETLQTATFARLRHKYICHNPFYIRKIGSLNLKMEDAAIFGKKIYIYHMTYIINF